jgi:S1-C subfamily serine protease
MNALDIGILLVLTLEAIRGAEHGLARSFFSLGGIWAGVLLGAAFAPLAANIFLTSLTRLLLMAFTVVIMAIIGGAIGHAAGKRLARATGRLRLTRSFDRIGGALFSASVSLFLIWIIAAVYGGMLPQNLNRQVRESNLIKKLDNRLPPAPTLLAKFTRLLSPLGPPEVFVGQEPQPLDPVDSATAAEIEKAVAAAGASTVKIEGVGCGGLINGSGFIAAHDLVITNAHVIAGIRRPVIIDDNGTHRAEPIYFDPDTDLAILRSQNLAGSPLTLSDQRQQRGASAIIIGYPAGGPQRAVPAGVLGRAEALGRDIYNKKIVARQIYQLQTAIESGNSGGPAVLPDGTVIGVIFARSQNNAKIGYAITSSAAQAALEKADGNIISTGRCASA